MQLQSRSVQRPAAPAPKRAARCAIIGALAASLAASSAHADIATRDVAEALRYDAAEATANIWYDPDEWTPRGWSVHTEARVWAPGMGGEIRLPGGRSNIRVARELDAGDPQATPIGEFRYRSGGMTYSFSGSGFGVSERTTADRNFTLGDVSVGAGDRIGIDIDLITVEAMVEWRVWQFRKGRRQADTGVSLDLDLGVGARMYDLNMRFNAPSGDASGSGFWAEPFIGARLAVEMLDRYTLETAFSSGGFSTGDHRSISWTAQVAFHWRFMENAGAHIGFRHQFTDLQRGSNDSRVRLNGSLSGLFAGVSIRF
ncbi:MAG: hypothetical protein EA376_02180 [Phycisphaeraceae bacterium]|nr:MAG: hypothetical protein EA376_02180 [Phycisphaeraceae bacterium]